MRCHHVLYHVCTCTSFACIHTTCTACAPHGHGICAQAARLSDNLLAAILRSYHMSRHKQQQRRNSVVHSVSHVTKTCARLHAEAQLSAVSEASCEVTRLSRERQRQEPSCHGKDWKADAILGGGLLQLVVRWGRADLVKQVVPPPSPSCIQHTRRMLTLYARCTHTQCTHLNIGAGPLGARAGG